MNRRMKIIFTASLLLNIVLVGIGAGLFYKYCQDVPIPADMSPEARNFVARTYQEGRADVRPLIDEVKARKRAVEAILMADAFDVKAYDAAVEGVLETQSKIMHHRAATMSRALEELSTEDRHKFAKQVLEGLSHKRPGGPRKHGHWDNKPGHERHDAPPAGAPPSEKAPN